MALDKRYINQVMPEQVIKTYADHGHLITVEEAEGIIEFMHMLAEIALDIAEEKLKKTTEWFES